MRKRIPPSFPTAAILAWYRANRREMPWRGSRDPYAVWLSETMLQQTRVETVRAYFVRFLARFPDVRSLAAAPLPSVLKLWEGLGYYSRARNLHAAAKRVAESGSFPETAAGWAELPGVGPYTAAAVASICSGEPVPVVDGNVARVAARFRAEPVDPRDPKARAALAAWLRPAVEESGAPGDFNQAAMELGETLCTPKSPRCGICPLRATCRAAAEGRGSASWCRPR
jgi:A/G-specific adenine glycosylase